MNWPIFAELEGSVPISRASYPWGEYGWHPSQSFEDSVLCGSSFYRSIIPPHRTSHSVGMAEIFS